MTKSELYKNVENGACMVVCEYRSSRVDHIGWRDKATGKSMEADILRHTVEVGDKSVSVSERMPDNWDGKTFTVPVAKGEKAVLEFSDWRTEKGVTSIRGVLRKLV